MSNFKLTKITSLKNCNAFAQHVRTLGIELPLDENLLPIEQSPFLEPRIWNGRTIGNRIAIQPMEGWDGTETGGVTAPMIRRWERFGESGAKLIWGGEAMAISAAGRANPNQLILDNNNVQSIALLRQHLVKSHVQRYSSAEDLLIGFQLTHSGRFCRPYDKKRWEPRIAYRHPLLDAKFGVTNDSAILSDAELDDMIGDYVAAALLAQEAGADFVDIKACHGYLLHEFLGATARPGPYGGSFENRTRLLLSIISSIQTAAPNLGIGVRLSAFDSVPYQPSSTPDPGHALVMESHREGVTESRSPIEAGVSMGAGVPVPHEHLIPYRFGFGISPDAPTVADLDEPNRLLDLLSNMGIRLINLTAGSPYYTPHLVRPASYPPSDGYQLFEDPLIGV